MKYLPTTFIILFTSFCFSQNTGIIVGKVFDNEVDNTPLVFADVVIKGSNTKVQTNETGLFVLENLEDGDYTLVCSFIGYETQEIDVKITNGNAPEIKLTLSATTISFAELAAISTMSSKKEDKNIAKVN